MHRYFSRVEEQTIKYLQLNIPSWSADCLKFSPFIENYPRISGFLQLKEKVYCGSE